MQNPGRYDMTIYQGATFALTLTWRQGEPPVAVNLTGYTARMQLRETTGSPSTVLSLTSAGGGGLTLGGAAGTIALNVSATQTAELTPGTYLYDLELVNGATVTRLVEGRAVVSPEVTR
jgi:hypothetical protein